MGDESTDKVTAAVAKATARAAVGAAIGGVTAAAEGLVSRAEHALQTAEDEAAARAPSKDALSPVEPSDQAQDPALAAERLEAARSQLAKLKAGLDDPAAEAALSRARDAQEAAGAGEHAPSTETDDADEISPQRAFEEADTLPGAPVQQHPPAPPPEPAQSAAERALSAAAAARGVPTPPPVEDPITAAERALSLAAEALGRTPDALPPLIPADPSRPFDAAEAALARAAAARGAPPEREDTRPPRATAVPEGTDLFAAAEAALAHAATTRDGVGHRPADQARLDRAQAELRRLKRGGSPNEGPASGSPTPPPNDGPRKRNL